MGTETNNAVTAAAAAAQFPAVTKEMIQSLKEIVNCPETEIYSVLKECNMDANEAVQRLLSLDSFHEVKSKRERRKEIKETQDYKSRVHNCGSNRGVQEVGKAAYKGQNGFVASSVYPSASHYTGGNTSLPSSHSDSFSTSVGPGNPSSASVQPSPGNQDTCSGTGSEHLSMADIVKMGKPPSKGSHTSSETSLHRDAFSTSSCNCHVESERHQHTLSQNSCGSEMIDKHGDTAGQNAFHDEWPVIEHRTVAGGSSVLNANVETHGNKSNVYQPHNEVRVSEGNTSGGNLSLDHNSYAPFNRQKGMDAAGGRSYGVDDLSSNSSSYDSHRSAYENGEGTGCSSNALYPFRSKYNDAVEVASSATISMQQLNLGTEEPADNCAVVLPNNLQELAADCSHLSFGTYRSGPNSSSNSLKNELGGSSTGLDVSSAGHVDTGNSGYNHDEFLGSFYDVGRATVDAKNYDFVVPSQTELIKPDIFETTMGQKVITTSSLPNFNSEYIKRAGSGLSFAMEDSKFRNVPPVQNDMEYSDSIRSDVLESISQFLVTPSVPSRYNSAVSSISYPTISMSEALRPGSIPLAAASSVLPQHLTAQSYPQSTMKYEQLKEIIGCPSNPQSHSSMPWTLQQAYLGSSAFHQSVAGKEYSFPQYRSGAAVSRLPVSVAPGGGHGSFGASNNAYGSFLHNSTAAPISMSDYEDAFRTQYKDANHLNPPNQDSRTLSSVPDSAYSNLLGQYRQLAGYQPRQTGQLPSQTGHYGSSGYYPSLYQSQMGLRQEHQRQSVNDSGLGGIQDLSPQQLHQIWQQTY